MELILKLFHLHQIELKLVANNIQVVLVTFILFSDTGANYYKIEVIASGTTGLGNTTLAN